MKPPIAMTEELANLMAKLNTLDRELARARGRIFRNYLYVFTLGLVVGESLHWVFK